MHLIAFGVTLDEAQKLAVQNNPHLKALKGGEAEAKAKKNSTDFLGRPKVGVALGGEFGGDEAKRDLLPLAYGYVAFTVYDGYQARFQQSAAQKEIEGSELQILYREWEIKKQAEELFLEVAYREEKAKAMRKERILFDRLKEKASDRKRAGMIGDADIFEFELRKMVLEAELGTLEAEKKEFMHKLALI